MVLVLQAPAKLNLYLGVHKQKDARGYHRVDSLMAAIGLADEVRVEPAQTLQVVCEPEVDIPQEKNTAYLAASLMGEACARRPDVRITIRKCIPAQSGMGGSSSDAAAVIKALCAMWGMDRQGEVARLVARKVGADVPFFLNPVPTLLEGAGDVPREVFPSLAGMPVAVVRERGEGVSTKRAYEEFDRMGKEPEDAQAVQRALRLQDFAEVARNISNNLDPIACKLKPEIAEVKRWLKLQPGVNAVQVTGSGSAVFAICGNSTSAGEIAKRAQEDRDWWSVATEMQ